MKLYIKNEDVLKYKDNFSKFVEAYFTEGLPATYETEECVFRQCASGKNRSFADMFCLVKTYFPDATEAMLAKEWLRLYRDKRIEVFYCSDINKIVSCKDSNGGCWDFNDDTIRSCGYSKQSIYKLATDAVH